MAKGDHPLEIVRILQAMLVLGEPQVFELEGKRYYPVGAVQGRASTFICLLLTNDNEPQRIVELTIDTENDSHSVQICKPDDEQRRVGDGQFLGISLIQALVSVFFLEQEDMGDDRITIVQTLRNMALMVIQSAQRAGVFCGQQACDAIMEYWHSAPDENDAETYAYKLTFPTAELQLLQMRDACQPDNPEGMRDFAAYLVAAGVLESLFGGDA